MAPRASALEGQARCALPSRRLRRVARVLGTTVVAASALDNAMKEADGAARQGSSRVRRVARFPSRRLRRVARELVAGEVAVSVPVTLFGASARYHN